MRFCPTWRPVPLASDGWIIVVQSDLAGALTREGSLVGEVLVDRALPDLSVEMFPPHLLNSLPGAVDENLVLKTVVSADLHCELQAVSVEPVTDVGVVSRSELVRAHQLFLVFLQFSKLKGQNGWEAHRFFAQDTPDLLPYLDRALVVEQRLYQPRLSEQLTLLFEGATFEEVNFEMRGEVKGLMRFPEQSDAAEYEAEVILLLHAISVDRIMCYNATAESERFDFRQVASKHSQSPSWLTREWNLLRKGKVGIQNYLRVTVG